MWFWLLLSLAILAIIWRRIPPKEAEIIGIYYSFDGVTWEGLQGAKLEPDSIIFGVSWKNKSSVQLNTLLQLDVNGLKSSQAAILQPNEEIMASFPLILAEGAGQATALLYEEDTMKVLDQQTVSFTVESVAPPVIEPVAHIYSFKFRTLEGPYYPEGEPIPLGSTIYPEVLWANDLTTHAIKGKVDMVIVRPDGTTLIPKRIWEQLKVAPGLGEIFPWDSSKPTGRAQFEVKVGQIGEWTAQATLTGSIV